MRTQYWSPIDDQFIPSGRFKRIQDRVERVDYLVPLTEQGTLVFKICGFVCFDMEGELIAPVDADFHDCRIKNINLTIVDKDGNEVDTEDIEYTAKLDPLYKNEGAQETVLHGTNIIGFPIERGALLWNDGTYYHDIESWNRVDKTDTIEGLLLRTIVSNYQRMMKQVSTVLNMLPKIIGYLTYSSYLDNAFMITSCTHDLMEDSSEVTLDEIVVDDLDIIDNY